MNELLTWAGWLALLAGVFFFFAGAVGLARFPDIHCRLHAVTKADTLGMGFLLLGLSIKTDHWQSIGVMLLIWLLVAASSAVSCQILARYEAPEDKR